MVKVKRCYWKGCSRMGIDENVPDLCQEHLGLAYAVDIAFEEKRKAYIAASNKRWRSANKWGYIS